jgi:hypothetical protein
MPIPAKTDSHVASIVWLGLCALKVPAEELIRSAASRGVRHVVADPAMVATSDPFLPLLVLSRFK